jgi:hypothetical protein
MTRQQENRPPQDKAPAADTFRVEAEAQKRKMDAAATKHANTIPGNTEANAGGVNREKGDRKARQNDRATNGGE